jgi:hypothetical protein
MSMTMTTVVYPPLSLMVLLEQLHIRPMYANPLVEFVLRRWNVFHHFQSRKKARCQQFSSNTKKIKSFVRRIQISMRGEDCYSNQVCYVRISAFNFKKRRGTNAQKVDQSRWHHKAIDVVLLTFHSNPRRRQSKDTFWASMPTELISPKNAQAVIIKTDPQPVPISA